MMSFLGDLKTFIAALTGKVSRQEMQELTEATAHIVRHIPLQSLTETMLSFTEPLVAEIGALLPNFEKDKDDITKKLDCKPGTKCVTSF
jgi:hypothetical protein